MFATGDSLWQKPLHEVASFWNSTATWRLSYFSQLKETDPATLSPGLQAEREFVLLEEQAVATFAKSLDTVIEMGCGVGRSLWQPATERPDHTFLGIDCAFEQLLAMKAACRARQLSNVVGIAADVERLPFCDGCTDGIMTLNQTFGTFLGNTRTGVLSNVVRMLRPGGQFLVGGFDNIDLAVDCYQKWGVPIHKIDHEIGFVELAHYNSFWQRQDWLERELRSVGLRMITAQRCELGYVLTFARPKHA